jgi:hypothetical protein
MRGKRNFWMPFFVALLAASMLVQAAQAGRFHFITTSFSLGSFIFEGKLAGVGNTEVEVVLTAFGTVRAVCQNQDGSTSLGGTPILVNVVQKDVFHSTENGSVRVEMSAADPTSAKNQKLPNPEKAGCPAGDWVVDILDGSTNWTAATIAVRDGKGGNALKLSFTCTTTFNTNGVAVDLSCVQTSP